MMKRLLAPAFAVLLIILLVTFFFEMTESEDHTPKNVIPNPTSSRYEQAPNPFGSSRFESEIEPEEGLQSAISQGDDADFVSGGDASLNNPTASPVPKSE